MASIIEILQGLYSSFYNTLSPVVGETYLQLFILTISLAVYSIFVWHFYKTLSKRDLFKIDLQKYNVPTVKHKTASKVGSVLIYIMKYGLLFPLFIIFWFIVLSLFLLVIADELTVNTILLASITLVSATRLISYYKEELSNDLAKLIPFALLAISLTDVKLFSLDITLSRIAEIPVLWTDILQLLIFSIAFEWILRTLYLTKVFLSGKKDKNKESS